MWAKQNNKIENLHLIRDKYAKRRIQNGVERVNNLLAENDLAGSMINSFFKDTVNGQILISLNKKPDHYVNRLSDFYVDDRVSFRNRKELMLALQDIEEGISKVVKHDKPAFNVGETVESSGFSNAWVRTLLKNSGEKKQKLKIVSIAERNLDPKQVGYNVVEADKKPFKKNQFYVSQHDITNGGT